MNEASPQRMRRLRSYEPRVSGNRSQSVLPYGLVARPVLLPPKVLTGTRFESSRLPSHMGQLGRHRWPADGRAMAQFRIRLTTLWLTQC
jgi:hypothetical protein